MYNEIPGQKDSIVAELIRVPVNHVQAYNFRLKENLAIYITARLILVLKIRIFSQYNAIQII